MKTALRACMAAILAMVGLAQAQAPDPWIGKRVFTQYGTVLKVGNQVVDDEGRSASLTASGKDRSISRVYRVEHVNGELLWLKDEQSGASGWVQSKSVIPYEQAIDFYTNQIRANPSSFNYIYRGTIWSERGEYDQRPSPTCWSRAIRLEPNEETAYCCRGASWIKKKDYDRAIADYNEAIRLESKFVQAYSGSWWKAGDVKKD